MPATGPSSIATDKLLAVCHTRSGFAAAAGVPASRRNDGVGVTEALADAMEATSEPGVGGSTIGQRAVS